jgi:hypothetical protein
MLSIQFPKEENMNLTIILEVAIGLIVVWFVLSMATIQFQEVIANIFKFRAKDLEKAIGQMLSSKTLVDDFYKHPLIQGLMKAPNKKPSYVPAREFALTLFNIITTAGTDQSAIQQALHTLKNTNLGQIKNWFKRSSAKSAINKLIEDVGKQEWNLDQIETRLKELAKEYPDIATDIDDLKQSVKEYLNSIKNLPDPDTLSLSDLKIALNAVEKINPKLARAIKSLISGAESFVTEKEKELAVARTYVETWFNNSMGRLSGWYKRRSQIIAFFIGLALAIFLNIDSVAIAKKLWIDPTMRAAILEIAPTLKGQPAAATSTDTTNTEMPAETPDAATQPEAGTTESAEQQEITKTPQEILNETRSLLDEVGLPVGWVPVAIKLPEEEMAGKEVFCKLFPQSSDNTSILPVQGISINDICYRPFEASIIETTDIQNEKWLFAWFVGILISAVATTQGAPFWFELLSKLINIRGAGVKPPAETSKENASG